MKFIRLAFAALALALALAARNAPAQSVQQILTFSINAEYEYSTNVLLDNDTLTNFYASHRTLLVGTHNIVKAIAVDLFGDQWTNWAAAYIVRRLNPTNGAEGIFLTIGTSSQDISSFFGTSYLDDFTHDAPSAFPGLANNFTPQLPIFDGSITNRHGALVTNTVSLADVRFLSLNTTNLKFNLIGVNLSAAGNGAVSKVVGVIDHVRYTNETDTLLVSSVGSLYINIASNLFNGTPFQPYSGPARGTFATGTPVFSKLPGPAGPAPPGPPVPPEDLPGR